MGAGLPRHAIELGDKDKRIRELEQKLTDAVAAVQGMFAACDEWAAEFTQKKRAMDWGVVNGAYLAAGKFLRSMGDDGKADREHAGRG